MQNLANRSNFMYGLSIHLVQGKSHSGAESSSNTNLD